MEVEGGKEGGGAWGKQVVAAISMPVLIIHNPKPQTLSHHSQVTSTFHFYSAPGSNRNRNHSLELLG